MEVPSFVDRIAANQTPYGHISFTFLGTKTTFTPFILLQRILIPVYTVYTQRMVTNFDRFPL